MIDWFNAKTNALEKAWRDYIQTKDDYKKQVGFCPLQPFPAGFAAGWEAANSKPNSPELAKWISVKDRLPEMNELCIVNTEWRGIVPATYGNESWIFDEGQGWSEKALSYASHWMPLPEPPKE